MIVCGVGGRSQQERDSAALNGRRQWRVWSLEIAGMSIDRSANQNRESGVRNHFAPRETRCSFRVKARAQAPAEAPQAKQASGMDIMGRFSNPSLIQVMESLLGSGPGE